MDETREIKSIKKHKTERAIMVSAIVVLIVLLVFAVALIAKGFESTTEPLKTVTGVMPAKKIPDNATQQVKDTVAEKPTVEKEPDKKSVDVTVNTELYDLEYCLENYAFATNHTLTINDVYIEYKNQLPSNCCVKNADNKTYSCISLKIPLK